MTGSNRQRNPIIIFLLENKQNILEYSFSCMPRRNKFHFLFLAGNLKCRNTLLLKSHKIDSQSALLLEHFNYSPGI